MECPNFSANESPFSLFFSFINFTFDIPILNDLNSSCIFAMKRKMFATKISFGRPITFPSFNPLNTLIPKNFGEHL